MIDLYAMIDSIEGLSDQAKLVLQTILFMSVDYDGIVKKTGFTWGMDFAEYYFSCSASSLLNALQNLKDHGLIEMEFRLHDNTVAVSLTEKVTEQMAVEKEAK